MQQVFAPVCELNVPAGQTGQSAVAPDAELARPASQGVGVVVPVDLQYVPGGQLVHDPAPAGLPSHASNGAPFQDYQPTRRY